jgi:hypothetical protein
MLQLIFSAIFANSFPRHIEDFFSKPILLYKECVFVLSFVPVSWYYFIGADKLSIALERGRYNPQRSFASKGLRTVPQLQGRDAARTPTHKAFVKVLHTLRITEVFIMLRIEYFDKNRFMKQVAASRGSVILHLDNGSTCDLKKDDEASAIFQTMDAPKKGFSISVSDPADVTGFLRYMLEAGRAC